MKSKMSKIVKRLLLIIALTMYITISFAMIDKKPTFADSGFGVSYDSGGSSSGSSHSGGSRYSSRNGSDDEGSLVTFIILFIILLIVLKAKDYFFDSKKNTNTNTNNMGIKDEEIENEIKQYIPNFDRKQFLNDGYKMYCDVQEAWMNFKLEDAKNIITDELYNMYESQLTTLEVKGEQNIMKDFILQSSLLRGVNKQNDTITITTRYIIEFYDYIAEQTTGKVLRGTDKRKVRVTYEMKFRQTLDESKKVTKCPNCGADIEMNTSGICEYCHTKLVTENIKWVLTEKKTINQEYV